MCSKAGMTVRYPKESLAASARFRFAVGGCVLGLFACTSNAPPGDEVMGTVRFQAQPVERMCPSVDEKGNPVVLTDLSDQPFDFEATFSRNRGTPEAFVTLNGFSRAASFDGQFVTSTQSAKRFFTECGECPQLLVEETLTVALLSKSQSDVAGAACPPNPLDGGVARVDEDGGITGPGTTAAGGFDMLRACGELVDVVRVGPDAGADDARCSKCVGCTLKSTLNGTRE